MSTKHPDCHCPRTQHLHGQRVTYVAHRCRCDQCRAASTAAMRELRRQKLYGRHHLVDAQPVRDHVRALSAQGMGWKRVADAAGVTRSTVGVLLYGRLLDQPDHPDHRPLRKQVSRDVADKLLAVQPDLADGQLVDATGSRRRVQALVTRGWALAEIARRLGVARTNLHIHEDTQTQVTVATAQAVHAIYEQLWDVEPPQDRWQRAAATRARSLAAARNWLPPMAWDDDTIDDPAATGHIGDVQDKRLKVDVEDILHFAAYCDTLDELAAQLGVARNTLDQHVRRHNLQLPRHIIVGQEEANFTAVQAGHARMTRRRAA